MIGGRVLDASAVAAFVRGYLSMVSWIAVARSSGLVFYLPTLALAEVRAVRPDAGTDLAELAGHSAVVLGAIDATVAGQIEQLLDTAAAFDALAGQVVHTARTRGWPVLSSDPARLHRLDPDIEVDPV